MEHEPTIAHTIKHLDALGETHAQRSVVAAALARAHYEQRERERAVQAAQQDQEQRA